MSKGRKHEVSSRCLVKFQVVQVTLGRCPKAVGDKAGNLIEPGWLKVISFGFSFSNNGELRKVSDLPRTVWGG